MTIEIDSERPPATLPGAAPVAMQRGRRSDRIALARLRRERRWPVHELIRDRDAMRARGALVAGLVAELETSRIESVAFVVQSDVSWPSPLYDLAITTARHGLRTSGT